MRPQEGNILAKHGLIVVCHPSKLLLHETLHCFSKPHKTTTLDLRNSLVNPGLQSHHPSCKDDECVIDEGHDGNRCPLDRNPVDIAEFGDKFQECESRCCIFIRLLLAVLYPPPQFPSGTERFRAVPSVSECFRVFPTIFQLSSERFRAVLSNSERFRAFPIYFIKKFKVHF